MKIGTWSRLALCAAPLLAGLLSGCSGFWDPPGGGGGGGGGGGTTLSSGNFYILNTSSTSSQITGYSIVSGKLTALSGSPYAVSGQAYAMAMDPTGTFLYVSTTNGIYLYSITAGTGALTAVKVVYIDVQASALQVDPAGAWLLDASATGTLNAIPITSTGTNDATRNAQSVGLAGATVQQMAVTSNGLIAVAEGSAGTQVFPFTTANATPLGSAYTPTIATKNTSGGAAISAAVDPTNRLLYIGETAVFPNSASNSGGLRAFAISNSKLTELTASPYASGGTGPHAIQPKTTGDYVYVANWAGSSAGNVTGFQVTTSGSSYTLTTLSPTVATGVQPVGIQEDSKLNFILTVNSGGSPLFSAFIFDTTTVSKLDLALTGSTGTVPVTIVAQ